MAKQIPLTDRSVDDLMNPLHTKDERQEIIEYFRNLQNQTDRAIEMVATQQVQCNCASAVATNNNGSQPTPAQETEQKTVAEPAIYLYSWKELQPFKCLAQLTVTDWLLVVIAVLLVINIFRKK